MPRFLDDYEERKPAAEGAITHQAVQESFLVARQHQNMMARRYRLSDRVHAHLYAVRNNQDEFSFAISVEGTRDSSCSEWPNSMTPRELVALSEIKALVDGWVAGTLTVLPPSTCDAYGK